MRRGQDGEAGGQEGEGGRRVRVGGWRARGGGMEGEARGGQARPAVPSGLILSFKCKPCLRP